jgi:protein O-mannosyl-transferase
MRNKLNQEFSYRLLLIILPILAFGTSVLNQFVYDDLVHIVNNPRLQSLEKVLYYFSAAAYPGDLYRPLLFCSYYLHQFFDSSSPFSFHLVNLALHLIVCQLAYSVLKKLFKTELALSVCLIFSVHPLHTEAVAYVSGRADLLSAAGVLLTMLLALKSTPQLSTIVKWSTLALQGLVFFAALLCKESAICYVLLCPLLLFFYAPQKTKLTLLIFSPQTLTAIIATLIYFALRYQVFGALSHVVVPIFQDNPIFSSPAPERVLVALALLAKYLLLIIFPLELSSDYSYGALAHFIPSDGGFNLPIYFSHLLLILALIAIAISSRLKKDCRLGLLWFFAAFAVTANVLMPIGTIFAERLSYLPSIGAILFLVALITEYAPQKTRRPLLLAAITICTLAAHQQSKIWRNTESLYEDQIHSAPRSVKAMTHYGRLLEFRGKVREAQAYYYSALKVTPNNIAAMNFLAESYLRQGNLDQAKQWFMKSRNSDPKPASTLIGLAKVAILENDYQGARTLLEEAVKKGPTSTEGHILLVQIYLQLNERDKARQLFRALEKFNPAEPALKTLGAAF